MYGTTVCGLHKWHEKLFEHAAWKMICSCDADVQCVCAEKKAHFALEVNMWFARKEDRCRKAIEDTQKVDLDILANHLAKLARLMGIQLTGANNEDVLQKGGKRRSSKKVSKKKGSKKN